MDSDQLWAPLTVTPAGAQVAATPAGLLEYLRGHDDFDDLLVANKALVFRGFGLDTASLDAVLEALLPNRLAYVHGNSPRTKVGQNVYTSTEYPPEFTISMHNEMSYAAEWPSRLMFFCEQAPKTGGATPVVDGVAWLDAVGSQIRAAFAGGVRYTQNLHGGVGLGRSWQQTFETDDRAAVEAFLATAQAEWEWRPDGGLRISQVRPATVRHPVTGTEVWFNQADQWHAAGLGDETAAALTAIMPPEELPQSVTFADGTAIPDDYIIQIQKSGLDCAFDVDWAAGDALLIDNVSVGHGRRPFTGPRRVLVAMSG